MNTRFANLFGGAAKMAPLQKQELSINVASDDLSPEAVVTSPNFNLIDGVLIGAVEVTPKMAENWLTRNKRNIRSLQAGKMGIYTEAMKKNQWDWNGESIKFDKEGNLVDGQNRLTSCVNAGVSFKTAVAFGIASADNVDRGKPRLVGQILSARGLTSDANVMSAAINALHAYADEGSRGFVRVGHGKHPLTLDDALEFAVQNQSDLNYSIKVTAKTKSLFNKHSLHATLHYLFAKTAGRALADQFYESLCNGTGLPATSPIYLLREKLIKDKASTTIPQTNPYAGMIIKGWNYFICGKELSHFRYVYSSDGVPEIKRSPKSK